MTSDKFGFQFDPFCHLDSTKDARLHEYLVIPKTVEIAWGDAPVAIFAQPGGGKSALRSYTEKVFRGTRGVKLPITYVPATYSPDPEFHFRALRQSLAGSIFIYLISYPDLFLQFSSQRQAQTLQLLTYLPYRLDTTLDIIANTQSIEEIEQFLGVRAISGIEKPGRAHQELVRILRNSQTRKTKDADIATLLTQAQEIFEIKSFHILVDGLDGFIETTDETALFTWIAPLLDRAESWSQEQIYLKFFLPTLLSAFPENLTGIQTATLKWDDGLLAEVIRRRLYVASGGAFDSLDAIATPELRNVEFHLARQLPAEQKLPRKIILKARHLLERADHNTDGYIHYNDVFTKEANYAGQA